ICTYNYTPPANFDPANPPVKVTTDAYFLDAFTYPALEAGKWSVTVQVNSFSPSPADGVVCVSDGIGKTCVNIRVRNIGET
ncbi:MAG: hypothetical protein AAGF95_26605, partial [Chloroflexota bacterium]